MKSSLIFTCLLLLIALPLTSATSDFAYNRLYENGQTLIPDFNYSINVNHSSTSDYATTANFWDLLDSPADILHNLLDNLAWSMAGHVMDTILDMNTNPITEIEYLGFNITSCTNTDIMNEGEVCWNPDQKTLNIVRGNGQVIQVGKELGDDGINAEGSFIADGSVVAMAGFQGDNPQFIKADGSNVSESAFVGVLTIDCNPSELCPVTVFGFVNNLDTSMWATGDKLYMNASSPGELTNVIPTLPNNPLWVASVGRVSSTVGTLFVNPQIDPSDGFLINNIWATGNITADNFIGNGSQLTGLPDYWDRTGTILSPKTAGDDITTTGNLKSDNFDTTSLSDTIFIGEEAGGSGTQSIAIGSYAGSYSTGTEQILVGTSAGSGGTGVYTLAIGSYAGEGNSGNYLLGIGNEAGYYNEGENVIAIGTYSASENTGNDVVAIGYQAGLSNTDNNQFILKQASVNAIPLIQGNFSSGFVGIGKTTPSEKLDVNGNIKGTNFIGNGSQLTGLPDYWNRTGTVLSPKTAGDDITTSGNITASGIGNFNDLRVNEYYQYSIYFTTPAGKGINIIGGDSTEGTSNAFNFESGNGASKSGIALTSGGGGGPFIFGSGNGGNASDGYIGNIGGQGGYFWLTSGDGGKVIGTDGLTLNDGGDGGTFYLEAGKGGNSIPTGTHTHQGGDGGAFAIKSGAGGNSTGTAGLYGGNSGDIDFITGNAGTGITDGYSGNITLETGTGSDGGGIRFLPHGIEVARFLEDSSGLKFFNNKKILFGDSENFSIKSDDTDLIFTNENATGHFKFNDIIDMNNNKIINVTDPTNDQDVATKKYFDDNTYWTRENTTTSLKNINDTLSVAQKISIGQAVDSPTIIGDVSGNDRGTNALDIQAFHSDTQVASGMSSVTLGNYNTASGGYANAIGVFNFATNAQASALGYQNTANGSTATALGYKNLASGAASACIGIQGEATGNYASSIGTYYNKALGDFSTAMGVYNTASVQGSVAIGVMNTASAINSIVLGSGITNSVANSLEIGTSNTAKIRLISGNLLMLRDNAKILFGASDDASIYYDGTNLVINPKVVGSGYADIKGSMFIEDDLKIDDNLVVIGTTNTASIYSSGYGYIGGDLNVSGIVYENTTAKAYAQTAYHNETDPLVIDLVTEDVYVNVTGLHLDYNNSIYMNGQAVIEKTNMYHLTGSISFNGGNSGVYRYNLFVNDVEEHACGSMRTTTSSSIGSMSLNCLVYLEEGDVVNMRVKDTTSPVQDVNIYTLTFNMVEI